MKYINHKATQSTILDCDNRFRNFRSYLLDYMSSQANLSFHGIEVIVITTWICSTLRLQERMAAYCNSTNKPNKVKQLANKHSENSPVLHYILQHTCFCHQFYSFCSKATRKDLRDFKEELVIISLQRNLVPFDVLKGGLQRLRILHAPRLLFSVGSKLSPTR